MNVLLVQPKQHEEDNYFINLGLATIGAILRNAGHDVSALGFDALKYSGQQAFDPPATEVVMVSGMITNVVNIRAAVMAVRERLPGATFVLGGGCPTAAPPELLVYLAEWFNYFVIGEGDDVVLPLLDAIGKGEDATETVTNVLAPAPGGGVKGEKAYLPPQIGEVAMPAHDLFDMESYLDFIGRTGRAFEMYSSRGCPWDCSFCFRVSGASTRIRSVDDIITEMDHLHEAHGVERFSFVDDTFGLKPRWLEEFCRRMKERPYGFRFQAMINSLRNSNKLDMMRDAGLFGVSMGIESGSQKILDFLGKKNDLEAARNLIRYCNGNDLYASGSFIIGVPGETWETIEETREFMAQNRLDSFQIFFLNPYPGTRIFDYAVETGAITAPLDYIVNMGLEDQISVNLTEHDDATLYAMRDHILDGVIAEQHRDGFEAASWKRFQRSKPKPQSNRRLT